MAQDDNPLVSVARDGTVTISGFSGLNNVDKPSAMPLDQLREAVNVDIDRSGKVKRRAGRVSCYTGTNIRSLWANENLTLFAEGPMLKALEKDAAGAFVARDLRAVVDGRNIAYTEINEDVIASDGSDMFAIRAGVYASLSAGVTLEQLASGGDIHLEEAYFRPLPAGHLLAYHKGCLWVARGNIAYRSRPQLYGFHKPRTDFVAFPSKLRVMTGTDGAIFFATKDRSYVITGGDEDEYAFTQALDYGAPETHPVQLPASVVSADFGDAMARMWLSNKGILLGLPSGQIVNLTQKRVAFPLYDEAALMYREREGLRQVIAAAPSKGGVGKFAIGDTAEAEIRRNGVIIN